MDDYCQKKSRSNKLRSVVSDNGNYVVAGVVLGALVLFGYQYYQSSRLQKSAYAASGSMTKSADAVAEGKLDEAETLGADNRERVSGVGLRRAGPPGYGTAASGSEPWTRTRPTR